MAITTDAPPASAAGVALRGLQVASSMPALQRLTQQVCRRAVLDALSDRRHRRDRRNLIPPPDLLRIKLLIMDDISVTARAAEPAVPRHGHVDAVGVDVAQIIGVKRCLTRERSPNNVQRFSISQQLLVLDVRHVLYTELWPMSSGIPRPSRTCGSGTESRPMKPRQRSTIRMLCRDPPTREPFR